MDFKEWLSNYYTKDTNSSTHLLMNGGKLCIPKDKELEFLERYSLELDLEHKHYITEKRPDQFKFMIDLDILDDEYWTKENIINITKFIQSIVYDFFKLDTNVICCTAPSKIKNDKIHTGVHLIWNRITTNTEDALVIRESILYKLQESKLNFKIPLNSWSDVLDSRIYTSNSYRMVGSDKLNFKTREPENRCYSLLFIMDSFGNLRDSFHNILKKDTKRLIEETSIRNTITKYLPLQEFPLWLPTANTIKSKHVKTNFKSISNNSLEGCKEYNVLSIFINNNLPKEYNNINIKEIRKYPDDNYLIITDSRYCMNILREHNSCGIYFLATPVGLYQKCLCPCDNLKGRLYGYCKDYTSICYDFDKDTSSLLFNNNNIKFFKEENEIDNNNDNIKNKSLSNKKKTKKKKEKIKNLNFNTQNSKHFISNHKNFCDNIFNSI